MQDLTEREQVSLFEYCIEQGIDLQYGKLSLCDLRNYRYGNVRSNRKFQLHSEDRRYPFSAIYDELKPACHKFLELKKKVRRMH